MKKIIIIAGDKSGDLYGGFLCENLNKISQSIDIYSFGGENLAKHSKQVINLLAKSVCGLTEVISSLGELINTFNKTLSCIKEIKPDLIILIDFPDFNLRLAKKLNKQFPIFYYISPQIWAWRKNRIKLIKKYIDEMIVLFKFEKEFYKKEGVTARYFGHPLLEIIKNQNIPTKKIISFLPGSRINEIKNHLPVMLQTKKILEKELPDYKFCIIRPQNMSKSFYNTFSTKIEIIDHSYKAIEESKFIIASSGTATVEIAILKVPFIIIYKLNNLSWQILKRIVNTKFVGMVNILSSKQVIEELLQKDANPSNIAQTTLKYLQNEKNYNKLKNNLSKTKEMLTPYGATVNIAKFIADYLKV
ncbi:MAG: lipid-A-disaccharide synthase [Candidatus Omnitrophica bacterium]|nr:lipid-A-disaccharide synthase [Candidatus Omnitrophota bacterium]